VPARTGQPPVIDTNVELQPGKDHTLVVVGLLADIEPLLLIDDNTLPGPGQARVRFVHASPNSPLLDIVEQGGAVLFSNVPFKGVGDYITLNAGTHNLLVREANTHTDADKVLLVVPNLRFNERTVHTIFAVGLLNGQPPLQLIISVDATPPPPPAVVPAVTATATRTATPRTATPTATPSPTPSPTPSATPTATATATKAASPTATGAASPTATGAASPTATGAASPTAMGAVAPTTPAATLPATAVTPQASPGVGTASPPAITPPAMTTPTM